MSTQRDLTARRAAIRVRKWPDGSRPVHHSRAMTLPPKDVCLRALRTRDPALDGRIFVAVTSTGIYCRPICPARTPKPENIRFFPSAAAAQEAGFRPCLRCRPEISPDAAAWRGTSNTVSRALALIGEGLLDGESGVEALADRLGVGERQLRRLFDQHLGAPPIAVAQTRRILFAKQLIQDTQLSMTDVAAASGFGSVRRFNETFQQLFGRPPGELRRSRAAEAKSGIEIGYTIPKEGAQMFFDNLAIPADAQHVAEAYELINYLYRPEVAAKNSDFLSYANGNLASQKLVDPKILDDKNIYPDAATLSKLFVITARDPATQRVINRLWTKVKTGR